MGTLIDLTTSRIVKTDQGVAIDIAVNIRALRRRVRAVWSNVVTGYYENASR